MAMKEIPTIPKQSLMYLLVCSVVLLAFVLLLIMPSQKSLVNLDLEVNNLKVKIEEQKVLFPAYQDLLAKLQKDESRLLPDPKPEALDRSRMKEVSSIFRDLARKKKLELDAIPDVNTISKDSNLLLVNATLQGNIYDFRRFLIELGNIPYLSHIEEIQVQASPSFKKINLKFWLLLSQ